MNKEFIEKLKEILETKTDSEFEEIDELESKRFNTIEISKVFVKMFIKFHSNFKDEKVAEELIKKYKTVYQSIYEKLLDLERDSNFGKNELLDSLNYHIVNDEINEFIDFFMEVYS